MRITGLRLAALLTTVGLTLTGCGGAPEPPPPPKAQESPAPSATATPSAAPTPPAMPAKARKNSRAGAIAFARHYVALINHAQAIGDTAPLAAVEDAACESCRNGREFVRRVYASGGRISGGELRVSDALAIPDSTTGGWTVAVGVRFGPQQVDWGGEKPDQDLGGGQLPLNLQVDFRDNHWKVLQWTRGA